MACPILAVHRDGLRAIEACPVRVDQPVREQWAVRSTSTHALRHCIEWRCAGRGRSGRPTRATPSVTGAAREWPLPHSTLAQVQTSLAQEALQLLLSYIARMSLSIFQICMPGIGTTCAVWCGVWCGIWCGVWCGVRCGLWLIFVDARGLPYGNVRRVRPAPTAIPGPLVLCHI